MKNADLEKANLKGAKLGGANFNGANLKEAILPHGQEYHGEGDLQMYGASARPSSTGHYHVRIEITDEDVKRKNDDDYEDKPKNDDPDDLV